jgi:DNA helicase-2/ATP-dependent DNA helicase PcrA
VTIRTYTLHDPAARVAYTIEYERLLNEEQQRVVFARGGPMLVLAGAGSGKTRTLTYRVARLLESGVPAERVLLLTFTNKAAREMLGRVGTLLGDLPRGLWGGTFHHVGNMILRRHAELLGYPARFNILDSEDTESLMALCMMECGVDQGERRFPKPAVLYSLHSMMINAGQPLAEMLRSRSPHLLEHLEGMERVFALYGKRKAEIGVMDYDDLLVLWNRLFAEHEDVWRFYAERFQHVLVDEYQDTNHLQGVLIERCAKVHNNLMVVGDDCQSIYRFRGADYSNILEFPQRHPNSQIFKLETNYRSTPEVIALANDSIRFNRRQYQKTLRAVQPSYQKPAVVPCRDAMQQASFVAQRILEINDEGVPLSEIAVLYRAHYQSMELQVELTRRGIAYIVRSGVRFFEQAHIKDVLSYLRLVFNPRDELAFHRILGTADGIGKRTAERIWQQLTRFDDHTEGWDADGIADALPKRASDSWDRVRRQLRKLKQMSQERGPAELIDFVMEQSYRSYLRKSYENFETRAADIQQLGHFAAQSETLEQFLTEISLQNAISAEDSVGGGNTDDYLVLSSVHQAKGLEFRAVFVIWLAEGRFPNPRTEEEDGVEEERRLFYVADTRAKNEIYLCYPIMVRERERDLT